MTSKRALERRLADLDGFERPRADLEQYATPAPLAAHLLHLADLQGDLRARTVVDLGAGTGILAIGAALRGAGRVLGVERDANALYVARRNAARVDAAGCDDEPTVAWVRGDAARAPLCPDGPVTVVSNPPFGAQRGSEHADRGFLGTAAEIADVSYTIHNAGSRGFVEAFAGDAGGSVTHAYAAVFDVGRQFPFHTEQTEEVDVEVFRIEWGRRRTGEDGPA